MKWSDVAGSADERTLRRFGRIYLPGGFLLLGSFFGYLSGSWTTAWVLWSVGAVLALGSAASPKVGRMVFFGLTGLTFPIGWLVFHVVLAVVYFLVITPFGLVMRLFGRDALALESRDSDTHWRKRPPAPAVDRYFRQF